MRKLVMIILCFLVITNLSGCDTNDINNPEIPEQPGNTGNDKEDENLEEKMKLKITVGSVVFSATFQDNETARAFKKMLPMTITMSELNNNEKYYNLQSSLPVNSSNPGTIQSGDLMLYGSQTFVLFYKSFSTSYSYTRIGKVDNAVDLVSALGSGNVTVTFELE